jgi:uncharacterized protein (TIGR02594 family)
MEWLASEPAPKMLREAMELLGVKEQPGTGSNPEIISWAKELGLYPEQYSTDSIPWCGLFQAICAKRAGWAPPVNPLWARNWGNWGKPRSGGALLGDILVFPRGTGGHVVQCVGETTKYYAGLGGNQSDMVNIVLWPKTPILAVRQAPWRIAQPPNVREVIVSPVGIPIGRRAA